MNVEKILGRSMDKEDTKLYRIIGFDAAKQDVLTLSEREIASAYRKTALKWHPDRNRDNPLAAEKFSQVFLAYETLSSPSKRKTYDDAIRAFRKRRERLDRMDSARRHFRDVLEKSEKASNSGNVTASRMSDDALKRMQKEIERLRKEASGPETWSSSKQESRKTQGDHNSSTARGILDAGPWAEVEGYTQFRSTGISDFETFEESILNMEHPS